MLAGGKERPRGATSAAVTWAAPVLAAIALAVHARTFDFVCDDAFIALREARNLALHGAPVYNVGERVEAATSPGWVVLLAAGLFVRVPPVALLQGLSLASGVLLVAGTWALARRLLAQRPLAQLFVLVALVLTAPIAAWSGGGLESCLFAACVTFAFARIDVLDREPSARAATVLGVVLALACLVRLEGLLLVVICAWTLRGAGRRLLVRSLGTALAPLVLLTLFRLAYYGLPLPHTFYAKTGGLRLAMAGHGLRYVRFFVSELGIGESLLLFASPFLVASSAATWTTRIFVPLTIGYVILVGGDFLDLFRFFVPLFPVLFVTFAAAGVTLLDRYAASPALRVIAGLIPLVSHGARQVALSARSPEVNDVRRLEVGIEPLGWTKMAARDWSRTGTWLAGVAEPGDTLATTAAGALPFFSGLPNYDLLGLAAPDVARDGAPLWVRPGHTRIATTEQIQQRSPTFLHIGGNNGWETRGYQPVHVRVTSDLTVHLLVRRDRAAKILARSDVTAIAAP
jgi:hypothetical protein